MTAFVLAALVALFALRPATAEARTGRQLWTAVCGAGWTRCASRTVWALTVVVLLVLASVGAGTSRAVYAGAAVLWTVGQGLASVVTAQEVPA